KAQGREYIKEAEVAPHQEPGYKHAITPIMLKMACTIGGVHISGFTPRFYVGRRLWLHITLVLIQKKFVLSPSLTKRSINNKISKFEVGVRDFFDFHACAQTV
ncbi:hypothetical protein, partial [Pseudoalteromonas sp. OF7H-1]|uniref:hypothetical protein n=1 Tax=Pseudoalteromonas sp. OF7H-1 TaxID=2917755 RepID=UPI001EF6B5B4